MDVVVEDQENRGVVAVAARGTPLKEVAATVNGTTPLRKKLADVANTGESTAVTPMAKLASKVATPRTPGMTEEEEDEVFFGPISQREISRIQVLNARSSVSPPVAPPTDAAPSAIESPSPVAPVTETAECIESAVAAEPVAVAEIPLAAPTPIVAHPRVARSGFASLARRTNFAVLPLYEVEGPEGVVDSVHGAPLIVRVTARRAALAARASIIATWRHSRVREEADLSALLQASAPAAAAIAAEWVSAAEQPVVVAAEAATVEAIAVLPVVAAETSVEAVITEQETVADSFSFVPEPAASAIVETSPVEVASVVESTPVAEPFSDAITLEERVSMPMESVLAPEPAAPVDAVIVPAVSELAVEVALVVEAVKDEAVVVASNSASAAPESAAVTAVSEQAQPTLTAEARMKELQQRWQRTVTNLNNVVASSGGEVTSQPLVRASSLPIQVTEAAPETSLARASSDVTPAAAETTAAPTPSFEAALAPTPTTESIPQEIVNSVVPAPTEPPAAAPVVAVAAPVTALAPVSVAPVPSLLDALPSAVPAKETLEEKRARLAHIKKCKELLLQQTAASGVPPPTTVLAAPSIAPIAAAPATTTATTTTTTTTTASGGTTTTLGAAPSRLMQPTRLFRSVSADAGTLAASTARATTTILGGKVAPIADRVSVTVATLPGDGEGVKIEDYADDRTWLIRKRPVRQSRRLSDQRGETLAAEFAAALAQPENTLAQSLPIPAITPKLRAPVARRNSLGAMPTTPTSTLLLDEEPKTERKLRMQTQGEMDRITEENTTRNATRAVTIITRRPLYHAAAAQVREPRRIRWGSPVAAPALTRSTPRHYENTPTTGLIARFNPDGRVNLSPYCGEPPSPVYINPRK